RGGGSPAAATCWRTDAWHSPAAAWNCSATSTSAALTSVSDRPLQFAFRRKASDSTGFRAQLLAHSAVRSGYPLLILNWHCRVLEREIVREIRPLEAKDARGVLSCAKPATPSDPSRRRPRTHPRDRPSAGREAETGGASQR